MISGQPPKLDISPTASIIEALSLLDKAASGAILLVDDAGRFLRTVTDGDLRRLLLAGSSMETTLAALPQRKSITLSRGYTRREALALMQTHGINQLPVLDENGMVLELVQRAILDKQILLSTPHMGNDEMEFVGEAFRTNWIAPLGPNVDAFENELAEVVGVEHAVALSSGTAAIHIALLLLDVGPADTVFCSTLTFAASVNPIVYQGATPVLIDSEPDSWNMSAEALERALSSAKQSGKLPKAVIIVSLYGQSADMDPLLALCDAYGVPVIEDAAESLGARYKGNPSGTFGLMGIYSFNGNKIITTSGGGMLVTRDATLARRARFLATQARDPAPHYEHSTIGYNYRLSNILAGVGRGQLRVLDQRVAARRRVFETYRNQLSDLGWLRFMPEPDWSYSTHWLTAVTIDPAFDAIDSAQLIARLADEFIEARPVWKPMHLQPIFANLDYYPHGNSSISDGLFARGLCLPSGSNIDDGQLARVIETIRSV
jgi:dTDP-4-amino-4,6-dideoxygalactose transaminase